MTNRQKITAWVIVTAIILIAAPIAAHTWLQARKLDSAAESTRLPVNTILANRVQSLEVTRQFTGTIQAQQVSDLAFEQSGTIEEVLVDEGDTIQPQQILATLDTRSLLASRKTIEANLAKAQAELSERLAGPREQTIRAAEAEVDAAQAQYDNAKFNKDRRQELLNSRSISKEEFDRARFAEKTAAANLVATRERLAELEEGTRTEQIAAADAAVQQLFARLDEIDIAIEKSKIRAPFAGTIISRHFDPGSIAAATVPVLRLQQSHAPEAWIGIPPRVASQMSSDVQHTISIDGQEFSATLKSKILEIDRVTRTQTVIFQLAPAADSPFIVGQICKIDVPYTISQDGFWLPTTALTQGVRGLWSIMIVQDVDGIPQVAKRDVEIIHSDTHRSFVKGTLEDGDEVIVDGIHRVVVGQSVECVPQIAQQNPPLVRSHLEDTPQGERSTR